MPIDKQRVESYFKDPFVSVEDKKEISSNSIDGIASYSVENFFLFIVSFICSW